MKMKSIIMSMLAVVSLAGCSKDSTTVEGGDPDITAGEATYATFTFKVDRGVNTYASMPQENTKAEEDAVSDVLMLVFDATNGKAGKLITKASATTTSSLTVKTTSGSKRIYVLTNVDGKTALKAKLDLLVEGTATLADLYTLATDEKFTTGGADLDMGTGFKELIVANKMVMGNVADAKAVYTLHPGISADASKNAAGGTEAANNNFKFDVVRAVAKANLKIELKDGDSKTTDKIFTLKEDVDYAIRNINRSVFLIQQYASDMLISSDQDHNKDGAVRPWSPFYDQFDGLSNVELAKIATYVPYFFKGYEFDINTQIAGTGAGAASKSVYFSPNSMNKALRGNTTYYGIRTQVQKVDKDDIATAITFESSTNKIKSTAALVDYDNTAGDVDFYFVRELPADMLKFFVTGEKIRKVFTDADVAFQAMAIIIKFSASVTLPVSTYFTAGGVWTAEELKDAYNGTGVNALDAKDKEVVDRYIGLYSDGYSYYRLNIYETTDANNKRHLVRRNHAYASTVTSFATLGVPNPDDLDKNPEIPVDADVTNVTATISVVDWHNINISEDL